MYHPEQLKDEIFIGNTDKDYPCRFDGKIKIRRGKIAYCINGTTERMNNYKPQFIKKGKDYDYYNHVQNNHSRRYKKDVNYRNEYDYNTMKRREIDKFRLRKLLNK